MYMEFFKKNKKVYYANIYRECYARLGQETVRSFKTTLI